MNKFLSGIDILTLPPTEVIKKILITSCHTFNTARNSVCYDIIVKKLKKLIQYFFVVISANAKSGPRNQDKKKQVNSL